MKKFLLGSMVVAVIIAGGPAIAADWTGFYVGLNAGVGINDSRYTLTPTGCFVTAALCGGPLTNNPLRTDSANLGKSVFTFGGQMGYNYQINMFVPGIETDFNYDGVKESDAVNRPLAAPLVGNFVHDVKQKLDRLGTVRARLGVTATDRWLLYGTAGLAYGHIHSTTSVLFTSTTDTYGGVLSRNAVGWTAGAGTEYAFAGNWSAKFEYLFVDLGSDSYKDPPTNAAGAGASYQTDLQTREHIIRFGLNYKFNAF